MDAKDKEARAHSFGRVARHYERGRPSYPEESILWIVGEERVHVVDLAAGTGKLTHRLVDLGHKVVAVEPALPMLERLIATDSKTWAVNGAAEAIPLRDRWADVVTAAQAFHWFDAAAAVPEIGRVLRPGGRLGLMWNLRDESVAWVRELSDIIASTDSHVSGVTDSERFGDDPSRGVITNSGRFGPVEHRVFRHDQVLDRDALIALVRSRSNVAALPEREREGIVRGVLDLCDRHLNLAGNATFSLPYKTHAFRTRAVGESGA